MSLDLSNYELLWPTELFIAEGERISRANNRFWSDRAIWLLTEALSGTTAVADFEDLPAQSGVNDDPWAPKQSWGAPQRAMTQHDWFDELISRAGELRHAAAPRPYWPQRRGQNASHDGSTPRDTRREFARIIGGFQDNGYLVEVFGEECVDARDDLPDASGVIERRLGIAQLWPIKPESWDEDTFYGLIEVFHDLVSRPRMRNFHSYGSCGWHHSEFHSGPAKTLYRVKVNEMLRNSGIDYELAAEGEDLGRLVAVTDDARSQLVHQALHVSQPDIQERTEHAIALFRSRSTSRESKRSAIVALAGILEERRKLIKDEMTSADEGALFLIANKFNLRHRDAGQHVDYDDNFLDWVFWWYLATVELTNRMISSRSLPGQSSKVDGSGGSLVVGGNTQENGGSLPF
ncbi:hypothetical protein [Streptomyces sp. So13.3]|uniref:hypothetical protein n=1 Tax=Streptomyces sp. So13.3 TaxID=2136173 RepID=UPI0031FBF94B